MLVNRMLFCLSSYFLIFSFSISLKPLLLSISITIVRYRIGVSLYLLEYYETHQNRIIEYMGVA